MLNVDEKNYVSVGLFFNENCLYFDLQLKYLLFVFK